MWPDEIMYIKSDGNYSLMWLYGHDDPIQLWCSLKAVSESFDEQMHAERPILSRIGKQYVLNVDYITSINISKNTLTLWRKGMEKSIVIKDLSHQVLVKLSEKLKTGEVI